ncbi:MAG: T9SS type A sorting domain-containing protein [Chitinophagaceae bacterium]|nr:T9SS type A sorting domain-containing protein [Chitinophagaceae bacterium]
MLAAGYSTNLRSYQFPDVNAPKSLLFYRLKMVDADTRYKLSPVRIVTKAGGSIQDFLLYPNPAISYVHIALTEAASKELQVQVTNQLGQMVKTTWVSAGTQLIKLDVSALPKGIYAVRITGDQVTTVKKLMIR